MSFTKTKKKPTKSSKQWRKNINIEDDIQKNIELLDNDLKNKLNNINESKKNEFSFTIDPIGDNIIKNEINLKGFLNKKKHNENETDKVIDKVINRKINQKLKNQDFEKTVISTNNNLIDLWEDQESTQKKIIHDIKYPNIVLPHPGLSYNPNKDATKNLLSKIVNLNKDILVSKDFHDYNHKITKKEVDIKNDIEDEEESDNDKEVTGLNVEDINKKKTRRKTKTERNRKIQAKFNRFEEKKKVMKKKINQDIENITTFKRFKNIQKENKLKLQKETILEKKKRQEKENLLLLGDIDE
jgi:hypothetical protein